MKKITFLLTLFFSVLGYSQVETFEGAWPPPGWAVTTGTASGGSEIWHLNTDDSPYPGHNSPQAAYVNRENIGQGNTEEDWLISNLRTVPQDGQLRFWTRQTQSGIQGTIYQVRVSTSADQMALGNYEILQSWTEDQLSNLNGDLNLYEEKIVDFPQAYFNDQVYIAFVRVVQQTGPAPAGDRWLIDDVNIVQKCVGPDVLDAPIATVYSTSAILTWQNNSVSANYEVEVLLSTEIPSGVATHTGTGNSMTVTGLQGGTCYQFFVRSMCPDSPSNWVGPFFFCTIPLGSICADPISVTSLPYNVVGVNTGNYGDDVTSSQGSACGATPAGTNYLDGNDVFYSYTATASGVVSVTMTPAAGETHTSLFVYTSCANIGNSCFAGVANTNSSVRSLLLNVVEGQQYIIVVSSSATNQTAVFDLLIQNEDCTPKPENGQVVPNSATTSSAQITWTSPGITSWEIAVQPAGATVPTGSGQYYSGALPYQVSGLTAGQQYQFWVRSECGVGSGVFSAWAGPFMINPLLCDPSDRCAYTFRLTDTGSNGWQGNTLTVFQNGQPVVVEVVGENQITTIGNNFTAGAGPFDVMVPLCPGFPYEIFWNNGGTNPTQIRFEVFNSFGQLEYAKTTSAGTRGTTLYESAVNVNCTAPNCTIPPTNITTTDITTTGFTINWSSPALTAWDIYIVPAGSPAPTQATTPTYPNVVVADPLNPSFPTTLPLLPDTAYDVYIRAICEPNSYWSAVHTVSTLPTCFKPVNPQINTTSITTTSVEVSWTNGAATDTQWEIIMVPMTNLPPAPWVPTPGQDGAILYEVNQPSPFLVTGLSPATIYHYFVRTVCPGDDKSTWAGPVKFNTVTCEEEDKCVYKFVLTDTGNNGWNSGRMQVRQNDIVVFELVMTSGSTITRNVALCPGVPFDVYWSVTGSAPTEIGFSIQNPFLDVIYVQAPNTGAPQTVLYAGVTNCTPDPCSKPINMTADQITSNSVQLSWEDQSSPTATLFDVYLVETGNPPPTNVPETTPTHPGVTNPAVITGLQPSTSYTYYVRAVCGDGVTSTWTILSPYTFVTKPENDDCLDAKTVTVNTNQECAPANTVSGSTRGATASEPLNVTGAGCGNSNDDVWFKFVASSTTHMINFSNITGNPATIKINHSLFSGPCNDLVKVYCSTAVTSMASNLTIGETYYIRVYTPGSNLTQYATFDLCITSPPANDECSASVNVPVNATRECTEFVSGYTLGATASYAPPTTIPGCGNADDDVWYHFTATSTIHIITVSNIVGETTDLNHALMAGDECGTLTQIYCSNPNVSIATGLTIGNVYKIRVFTNGANVAQYASFDLCITTPPPVLNDECSTAEEAVVNNGLSCLEVTSGSLTGATASGGNTSCPGTEDDDVWFSFVANSDKMTIKLDNIVGTTTNLNHAVYSGDCDGLIQKYCSDPDESMATGLVEGQTYFVRVWTSVNTIQDVTFDLCITRIPPPIYASSSVYNTVPPESFTVANLVQDVLIGAQDQCAEATNITFRTGTTYGSVNGIGYFNKVNSDFGIDQGVVLSTGAVNSTPGPNDSALGDGTYAWLGDADIEQVIFDATGVTMDSHNATVLEFDFIPYINHIEFPFIFASEEYGTFQCSYSDSFAFLLTGPDGETVNLAVIPGTDDPVSVVTIRNNLFNGGCSSENVGYFDHFFGNNGTNPLAAPIDFNGMTVRLKAEADVIAGAQYHIKLVIADRGDPTFDSAVFIGKFQIGSPPDLGEDLLIANGNALCNDEEYVLNANITDPELYTFQWFEGDDEIEGETNSSLVINHSGTYSVRATKTGTPCFQIDEITVEYFIDTEAGTPENLVRCDASGNALFDLTEKEYIITLPFAATPGSHAVSYFTSEEDAINNEVANAIPATDPGDGSPWIGNFPGVHEQMIYVRIQHVQSGCDQVVAFQLIVEDLTPDFTLEGELAICPEGTTTITVVPTDNDFDSDSDDVTYVWMYGTTVLAENSPSLQISGQNTGTYTVTVNNSGCEFTETFEITNDNEPWDLTISSDPAELCPLESGVITVVVNNNPTGAPVTYTYTLPDGSSVTSGTNTMNVTGPGIYQVSVSIFGCVTGPVDYEINSGTGNWLFDITSPQTLCQFETGTMSVDVTNAPAGAAVTYNFVRPDGSSTSSASNSITVSDWGGYDVSVTILGCTSPVQTFTINETIPNWTINFTQDPYTICAGENAELAFTGSGFDRDHPNAVYTWTLPDGSQRSGQTISSAQIGTYTLEVDIFGCSIQEQVEVQLDTDSFNIAFENGCDGSNYKVTAQPEAGSFDPTTATYSWTGTGTIDPATVNSQTAILRGPGTYTVTITTPDGCSAEKEFAVDYVRCQFQKGISPDGNGENDSFDLTGYNVKHISIFNRWGTMVFQYDNYTNQWMGQDNTGDELPDGTYFFVIDTGAREESGWIYLNRKK